MRWRRWERGVANEADVRQVSVGGGDRGEVSRKETATARYEKIQLHEKTRGKHKNMPSEGSKSYLK